MQATLRKLLTYYALRSTQPPTLSEMATWLAHELRGEDLMWLIGLTGAVVRLPTAPRVQLFADAANGWPHSALQYH